MCTLFPMLKGISSEQIPSHWGYLIKGNENSKSPIPMAKELSTRSYNAHTPSKHNSLPPCVLEAWLFS